MAGARIAGTPGPWLRPGLPGGPRTWGRACGRVPGRQGTRRPTAAVASIESVDAPPSRRQPTPGFASVVPVRGLGGGSRESLIPGPVPVSRGLGPPRRSWILQGDAWRHFRLERFSALRATRQKRGDRTGSIKLAALSWVAFLPCLVCAASDLSDCVRYYARSLVIVDRLSRVLVAGRDALEMIHTST